MLRYLLINCFAVLSLSAITAPDDLLTFAKLAYEEAFKAEDKATKSERYTFVETLLTDYLKDNQESLDNGEPYYYLGKVHQFLKKGSPEEDFKKSVSLTSEGAIAGLTFLELGVLKYKAEEEGQALGYLKQATQHLEQKKLQHYAHYLLANVAYNQEGYEEAQASAQFVLNNSKEQQYKQACHLMLARISLSKEQYPEAYTHYQECLDAEQGAVKAEALKKCTILSQTLDVEKTVDYCKLVLETADLKPFHSTAALLLMIHEMAQENLSHVLDYEKYGDEGLSKPHQEQRLYLLAKAYDAENEREKAVEFYQQLSKRAESSTTRFETAYILFTRKPLEKVTLKELQEFLEEFKEEFGQDTRYQSVTLLQAEKFYEKRRLDDALSLYTSLDRKALEAGNLQTVDYKICKIHLVKERFSQATDAINFFVKQYPKEQKGAYLHYDRATLALGIEKVSEAKISLEKVLLGHKVPDDLKFNALTALANVCLNEKSYQEAVKHYGTLVRDFEGQAEKPQDILEWNFWLAYSYYKIDALVEARQGFIRLREKAPDYKILEVTKVLALMSYKEEKVEELQREVARYRKLKAPPLPATIYTYLALDSANKKLWVQAWSYFKEVPPASNDERVYTSPLLELYTEAAVETTHYKEALHAVKILEKESLAPYNKARNLYRKGLALFHLSGAKKAESCVVEAIKINPSGLLKYQLLLLHGKVEYGIGNKENATRLLRQVVYFAPEKYKELKKEALVVLIDRMPSPLSEESKAILNEYKKELEILQ